MRPLQLFVVVWMLFQGTAAHAQTPAADVTFDNTGTSYTASDVQAALEEVDAAVLGDVASFRDVEFPEPVLNGSSYGLVWPVSDPSATEFFLGVRATDNGGSLIQPDNEFCIAYNLDDCGQTRIDAMEHAWRWSWGSGAQTAAGGDVIVENDAIFTASDGTSWRPWAFHINVTSKQASLRFDTSATRRALTLEENGNVRIGPEAPGTASHQLEVIGDALVEDDLHVEGDLIVQGAITQTANPTLMFWGSASDASTDTGDEVCATAGLTCFGASEPDGTPVADCATTPTGGVLYARCRRP